MIGELAPTTKAVVLSSTTAIVGGLSMRKLVQLFQEFPIAVTILSGDTFDLKRAIALSPNMGLLAFSLAVIGPAKRWRRTTNEQLVDEFDWAPLARQVEVLAAIFEMTFTGSERATPLIKSAAALLATSTKNSEQEPSANSTAENTSETLQENSQDQSSV